MKNIWLTFIKPKGVYAKWLVLIMMGVIAYLWSYGHFDVAKEYLATEQLTMSIGSFEITLYDALKAILMIVLIFWVTAIVVDFSDKRIASFKSMRVANKALLQKALQIGIYFFAFIFTLNILGIDLTSLTILSGALGIGLGFGLQKIASNFVSGIILLLEKSIKPGDLIELEGGTFGYVRKSSSRATLVETFEGKEILVPNEEFIVKQVVNWTLSNHKARVTVTFGVSYGSDIEKARELALEAAIEHERSLTDPKPLCFLDNFGDSSVDFILYFWVADANDGLRNAKSAVMFSLWHKLHAHNIDIPFPQRDVNIRGAEQIKALMSGSDDR